MSSDAEAVTVMMLVTESLATGFVTATLAACVDRKKSCLERRHLHDPVARWQDRGAVAL